MKRMPPAELEANLGGLGPDEPRIPTLESRATIEFPESLDLDGIDDLFDFIGADDGHKIYYKAGFARNLDETGKSPRRYSTSGVIIDSTTRAPSQFESFRSRENEEIRGIRFELPRYASLNNYDPKQLKIFNEVRSKVEQYFSQRSTTNKRTES